MLEEIKMTITTCPCDGNIYLVHKLSDCSGFLCLRGALCIWFTITREHHIKV